MDVSTFMFKVLALAAGFRDEAGETALSAGCQAAVSGRESSGHIGLDLLSSGSEEHQRTLMRRSDTQSVL